MTVLNRTNGTHIGNSRSCPDVAGAVLFYSNSWHTCAYFKIIFVKLSGAFRGKVEFTVSHGVCVRALPEAAGGWSRLCPR